jgi:hypothetical protein
MATTFSAKQAIGSGFQLVRTHPKTVLIWAAVYLVAFMGPYYLLMRPFLPDLIGIYQSSAQVALGGGQTDPSRALEMQMRMLPAMLLTCLLGLIFFAVVVSAIYRAVLAPADDRYGYLRLGRQELWLGVTALAFMAFYVVLAIVTFIPVGILAAVIMFATKGTALGGLLLFALMVAAYVFILWVMLRLSMAFPMSFARRRFVLFRSWDFTKGQALKMFLVALAVGLLLLVVEVVIFGVFGLLIGLGGLSWRALLDMPPEQVIDALFGPGLIIGAVIGTVLGMAIYAIMIAPWGSIYQQLTADDIPV